MEMQVARCASIRSIIGDHIITSDRNVSFFSNDRTYLRIGKFIFISFYLRISFIRCI